MSAGCSQYDCGHMLTITGHCSVRTCGNHWNNCPQHKATRKGTKK